MQDFKMPVSENWGYLLSGENDSFKIRRLRIFTVLFLLPFVHSDSAESFDPELTTEGLVAGSQGRRNPAVGWSVYY